MYIHLDNIYDFEIYNYLKYIQKRFYKHFIIIICNFLFQTLLFLLFIEKSPKTLLIAKRALKCLKGK